MTKKKRTTMKSKKVTKATEMAEMSNRPKITIKVPAKTSKPGDVQDGDLRREDLVDRASTPLSEPPQSPASVEEQETSQPNAPALYFVNHMPSTFTTKHTLSAIKDPIDVKPQSKKSKVEGPAGHAAKGRGPSNNE